MSRILVVDDDPEIRDLLQDCLRAAGHELIFAANGKDAVDLCAAHPVELVITDLIMPEKEGLETIQELRARWPDLKIIAISGAPTDWKVLEVARKLGAHQTLAKPFLPDEILAVVRTVLEKR